METKICTMCGIEFPSTEEHFYKRGSGSLRTECKECHKNKKHGYYIINREHILKRVQKRYEQNKEPILQYARSWRQKNSNKCTTYKRKYKRERYRSDERFRIIELLRSRLRNALKTLSKFGKLKNSNEYGIDYQAIFDHLGPCPGQREDYHIDHIIPLSSFNLDDPEQVKKAFAPENHQWLLKIDNLIKGNSLPTNK